MLVLLETRPGFQIISGPAKAITPPNTGVGLWFNLSDSRTVFPLEFEGPKLRQVTENGCQSNVIMPSQPG